MLKADFHTSDHLGYLGTDTSHDGSRPQQLHGRDELLNGAGNFDIDHRFSGQIQNDGLRVLGVDCLYHPLLKLSYENRKTSASLSSVSAWLGGWGKAYRRFAWSIAAGRQPS
jgi:hypothetical protein